MQHQPVANQPAVDEDEDRIAIVLLHLRARNETPQRELARRFIRLRHLQHCRVLAQIDQVFQQMAAEHLKNAFTHSFDRRGMQQIRAAVPEFESLIGCARL